MFLSKDSKNNCVYHTRHKEKPSTSLNAVFNVVSDDLHFEIVISNIHGQKMPLSASSQSKTSGKSIFVHFEVIFPNV